MPSGHWQRRRVGKGYACLSSGDGLACRSEPKPRLIAFCGMKAEGLAASTQSTILCTIRSVQPGNEPLRSVQVKVPARSVQAEVLSREEIKSVLDDLRSNEEWFYPALPCGWAQVSGMQKHWSDLGLCAP